MSEGKRKFVESEEEEVDDIVSSTKVDKPKAEKPPPPPHSPPRSYVLKRPHKVSGDGSLLGFNLQELPPAPKRQVIIKKVDGKTPLQGEISHIVKDDQYHLDSIAAFFLERAENEPLQEDRDERENFFRKIDSIKDPKVLATQVTVFEQELRFKKRDRLRIKVVKEIRKATPASQRIGAEIEEEGLDELRGDRLREEIANFKLLEVHRNALALHDSDSQAHQEKVKKCRDSLSKLNDIQNQEAQVQVRSWAQVEKCDKTLESLKTHVFYRGVGVHTIPRNLTKARIDYSNNRNIALANLASEV